MEESGPSSLTLFLTKLCQLGLEVSKWRHTCEAESEIRGRVQPSPTAVGMSLCFKSYKRKQRVRK